MSDNANKNKNGLWDFVKAISTLSLVGVFTLKVYLTPIDLTVDFPTLLSLLLALFSVALAALFYFKATDTSNTFYDNTYNFTKDIAQLLVKMESGFGERLRNLDEGYTSMRDTLQHYNERPSTNVEETKKKIQNEESEVENISRERSEIIKKLIEQSNLQKEERAAITEQLNKKEMELTDAQRELGKMNKRLLMARMDAKRARNLSSHLNPGMISFTKRHILKKIGIDTILESSRSFIEGKFAALVEELPEKYIDDMEFGGFYDNGLTDKGFHLLRELAENEIM